MSAERLHLPDEDPAIPVLTERLDGGIPASAPSVAPGEDEARRAALAQLAAWLPAAVEELAAQHVEAAIEGATERLAQQLRAVVAAAVRDSVEVALAAELERLRNDGTAGRR